MTNKPHKLEHCTFSHSLCSARLHTLELHRVEETQTQTIAIACKYCGSKNVVKNGTRNGFPFYLCNDCHRTFVANDALPRMRHTPEQIGAALSMFYEGMSLNAIRRQLQQDYNVFPSDSTVYEWIVRFTKIAIKEAENLTVHASDIWVVDETVLDIDGENCWFWDVIDDKTRYLIASHLSFGRTMNDAVTVLQRAERIIEKPPKFIVSDGLAAYPDAVERVFGADTKHIRAHGLRDQINTNLIERFHGTIKQRTKVMRGMQNKETAKLIMGGWLVHYNFLRPHEALGNKTPGEMAKVGFPHKTWAEVVKHGYFKTHIITSN